MIECKLNIQLEGFKLDAKFIIPDKGITLVFGPSGSGKTTLLRAIAGLEKSDTGFLKVGDSIWQSDHNFVPTHKRQIGYVFQDAALFDHLNVEGNLNYVIKRTDPNNTKIGEIYDIESYYAAEKDARNPPIQLGRTRINPAKPGHIQFLKVGDPDF